MTELKTKQTPAAGRLRKFWGKKQLKATIAQDLAGQRGPLMDHYYPKLRPQTTKTIAQIKNHYFGLP